MTNTIARIKLKGKTFEILVDNIDKALEFKKGKAMDVNEFLAIDKVFSDSKKGFHAGEKDLQECFQTDDIKVIAEKIIKQGEVQLPQEYKEKQHEGKTKQIVNFLVVNAVDPRTGRPYTAERIERSMDEVGINITNKPIESQIAEIVEKLSSAIPIKIETKRIKILIPAQYTGLAYGFVQNYKESEEWMNNGDLQCVVNVPVGFQIEFYDKLNSMTHGSVVSEEVMEK